MLIGLTYDLRDEWRARGYGEEDVAEFDSVETIDALAETLTALGHTVDRIGSAFALTERLARNERWDLVFNICEGLHGFGRESLVPAMLEAREIPCTFSDSLVTALTLHKATTKRVLRDHGIPTAAFALVERVEDLAGVDLPYPLFAKPVAEGTSKGVTAASKIRDRAELESMVPQLLERYAQPVLIETYLPGREFTVGLTGTGDNAVAVAAMEIHLKAGADAEVYTWKNKEECETLVEYRVADDAEAQAAIEVALRTWRALGCRDAGRVDVRLDGDGVATVIEVNPLAGLHPSHSDLPIMSTQVGLAYPDLIARIVASASERLPAPTPPRAPSPDVLIIHDDVGPNPRPDEVDTIEQADEVEKVLVAAGMRVERLAVNADLEAMRRHLLRRRPGRIFNLVESLSGHGDLSALVPAVIETMGIPLCGASADNLWRSADKFLTKRDLRRAGLPTAEWLMRPEEFDEARHGQFDWIIKSLREHASIGLDAENILRRPTATAFRAAFERIEAGPAGKCFAEVFIPGREFNLSVLVENNRIEVFPPAEIDFSGMPTDEPHIVGYRAKWDPESPVFDSTPRTFDFPAEDAPLLAELIRLTEQTAEWFELRGYARVDFRVDADRRPWILEVNANPGIHPEAGYAAAAARAGIPYDRLIQRFVAAAR